MPYSDTPVANPPSGYSYSGNTLVANSVPATTYAPGGGYVGASAGYPSGTSSSPNVSPTVTPSSTGSSSTPNTYEPSGSQYDFSKLSNPNQQALVDTANKIGADPADLYGVIHKETNGSFSPAESRNAPFIGLIQFGPNEQKKYGVSKDQSFPDQLDAAAKYLTDRGWKPGMGLGEMYSIVNAGSLKPDGTPRWNARDSNNSVRGHVADIQANFMPQLSKVAETKPASTDAVNHGTLTVADMNAEPPSATRAPAATDFQQQLFSGQVPWAGLPTDWQATLSQKLGPNAEAAYELERARMATGAQGAAQEMATGKPPATASDTLALNDTTLSVNLPLPSASLDGTISPQIKNMGRAEPGAGVGIEMNAQVPFTTLPTPRPAPVVLPSTQPLLKKGSGYKDAAENTQIKQYQETLARFGLYKGPIDGKYGPLTMQAVKDWQKANGLRTDGKIGGYTGGHLRNAGEYLRNQDQSNFEHTVYDDKGMRVLSNQDLANYGKGNSLAKNTTPADTSRPGQGLADIYRTTMEPLADTSPPRAATFSGPAPGSRVPPATGLMGVAEDINRGVQDVSKGGIAGLAGRIGSGIGMGVGAVITPIQQFLVDHGIVDPETVGLPPSQNDNVGAGPNTNVNVNNEHKDSTYASIPPAVSASDAGPEVRQGAGPGRSPSGAIQYSVAPGEVPAGDRIRSASQDDKLSQLVQFNTMYTQLPHGSVYTDPQGVTRRKR